MWEEKDKKISRSFKFKNFKEAFSWMTAVAFEAEKMEHHPDWTNSYNQVDVSLTTHSEGKVTEKDRKLADKMDRQYSRFE